MKFFEEQSRYYEYCCTECGNTFSHEYSEIDPEKCYECGAYYHPFEEDAIDEKVTYTECPLCQEEIKVSQHLLANIKNKKTLFFANLITHYRHVHRTSWNKNWGRNGYYYRQASYFGDYDTEKKKVNNQIKRALIRKLKSFFKENRFVRQDFYLKDDEEKTIELIHKTFP